MLKFTTMSHLQQTAALTIMQSVVRCALSASLLALALASCGGSGTLLRSLDGGSGGAAARGSDGGTAGIQTDDAGTSGGPDAQRMCGDLPERALFSVGDVRASLTAEYATRFKRGWRPCVESVKLCPQDSPDVAFDQSVATMQCGQDSLAGFQPALSLPITIVDTGQKTATLDPIYELQVHVDSGMNAQSVVHYQVRAQGDGSGAVGFELLDPEMNPPQWVAFEPLLPVL